jgi:hypothetical protein
MENIGVRVEVVSNYLKCQVLLTEVVFVLDFELIDACKSIIYILDSH